ncbi:MAG: hypothetical protein WCR12_04950 [Dysgonamonadaceae bacterium]
MKLTESLKRSLRSGGHGVHSPFAYKLITDVIREKYVYYAYEDVERALIDKQLSPSLITEDDRLAFRLTYFFKSDQVLLFNPENNIQTLFVLKANPSAKITSLVKEEAFDDIAWTLLQNIEKDRIKSIRVTDLIDKRFDAIFLDINQINDADLSLDKLIGMSNPECFWYLRGIFNNKSEEIWRQIADDQRLNVTFDLKKSGIAIINSQYNKINYLL